MSTEYQPNDGQPRRSLASSLVLPLLFFLLGLVAMGWVLTKWDYAARLAGIRPAEPVQRVVVTPAVRTTTPAPAPAVPAAVAPGGPAILIDPELGRRVTSVEQRIEALDSQARAAVGNADRAEGLLVAFAARRALDRGVALGYIEGLLRQRFGNSQRQAVATIITASRQPVTLEELQEELQEVGASLTGGGPDQDWWTALKSELSNLVTVRKRGTPSTVPAERLARARDRLQSGQVDVALAEVLRLPARDAAADWIASARRYVAARRALDTIETAALLDPRNPPAAVTAPQPAQGRPLLQ